MTDKPEWMLRAKALADREGRDYPILASYFDPDPDKLMGWSFEPCARQHERNFVCIQPNGHAMLELSIPTYYAENVGGALVDRAISVIQTVGYVPAYLHQFENLWEQGLRYGSPDFTFWDAIRTLSPALNTIIDRR